MLLSLNIHPPAFPKDVGLRMVAVSLGGAWMIEEEWRGGGGKKNEAKTCTVPSKQITYCW